jgi:hypothetical protein
MKNNGNSWNEDPGSLNSWNESENENSWNENFEEITGIKL